MNTSLWNDIKTFILYSPGRLNKIIALNVAIFLSTGIIGVFFFLFQINFSLAAWVNDHLGVPAYLGDLLYKPYTIISYQFLHSGFFHLFFNMLWLYWFGQLFEEFLGYVKILWVYLLGGIAGATLYITAYNVFPIFASSLASSIAIGASASTMAVVAAAATLLPDYTFRLILLGPVRIKYIAAFYFISDFLGIAGSNAGGHIAHLGGAIFGFLYIKQLQSGTDWSKPFEQFFSNLLRKKAPLKVVSKNEQTTASSEKVKQAEIDAILDKISASGYDKLTQKEKETLFKAGK